MKINSSLLHAATTATIFLSMFQTAMPLEKTDEAIMGVKGFVKEAKMDFNVRGLNEQSSEIFDITSWAEIVKTTAGMTSAETSAVKETTSVSTAVSAETETIQGLAVASAEEDAVTDEDNEVNSDDIDDSFDDDTADDGVDDDDSDDDDSDDDDSDDDDSDDDDSDDDSDDDDSDDDGDLEPTETSSGRSRSRSRSRNRSRGDSEPSMSAVPSDAPIPLCENVVCRPPSVKNDTVIFCEASDDCSN
eukprot:Awhi_evm1s9090